MTPTISITRNFKLAVAVPLWALRFYIRHFLWVVGISLIPSLHRFLMVYFQPDWPGFWLMSLEILVMVCRLLLLVLIFRITIHGDPVIRSLSNQERKSRIHAFFRYRWLSLVFQFLLLLVATMLFDIIPERVLSSFLPPSIQHLYLAILLGIKNPTIIAWVIIWMVGIPRQMLLVDISQDIS